jgi:serine/threonine protein kinase
MNDLSLDEQMRGTCAFLAPEILLNNSLSFANDWWSVGVTAFAATLGYLPFDNQNLEQMQKPFDLCAKMASSIRGLPPKDPDVQIGGRASIPQPWTGRREDRGVALPARHARRRGGSAASRDCSRKGAVNRSGIFVGLENEITFLVSIVKKVNQDVEKRNFECNNL